MSQCARHGCFQIGISKCSICLKDLYCSGDCQKADWKEHKLICKTLKKFSNQLQPFREVVEVINEIILSQTEKIGKNVRVLGHLLSYAKFQFGDRIPGKSYRERGYGNRISNWDAEMGLCQISRSLVNAHIGNVSLSLIIKHKIMIPCLEMRLELLKPWIDLLDSNDTNQIHLVLKRDQINQLLDISSGTENSMASIYTTRNEFNLAERHCRRALIYAKRYEGEIKQKTNRLCDAYEAYCQLRMVQLNYTEAVTFAEESYNCVAVAYNPVHPQVQVAAGNLIECLIHKGDLYDGERYAQFTLDSLKDSANGVDQDSEAVAIGHYNLSSVILKQNGDLVKAERLAREAYRIRYIYLYISIYIYIYLYIYIYI
jgi:tetratricopeptide (TPR) repeat protein